VGRKNQLDEKENMCRMFDIIYRASSFFFFFFNIQTSIMAKRNLNLKFNDQDGLGVELESMYLYPIDTVSRRTITNAKINRFLSFANHQTSKREVCIPSLNFQYFKDVLDLTNDFISNKKKSIKLNQFHNVNHFDWK
jgi:hypothetical protein